jgi:hypothetical protein
MWKSDRKILEVTSVVMDYVLTDMKPLQAGNLIMQFKFADSSRRGNPVGGVAYLGIATL